MVVPVWVVLGQFEPPLSLFATVEPGQHLNLLLRHAGPAVEGLWLRSRLRSGLRPGPGLPAAAVVGQLDPFSSLLAILVPGQHLYRAALHGSAVVAVVVVGQSGPGSGSGCGLRVGVRVRG